MKPIAFPEATSFYPAITTGPDGPEKSSLHFYQDPAGFVVSCWEPSQQEIDELIATRRLWVILALKQQPSLSLMTHTPFASRLIGPDGKPIMNGSKGGKKA